MEEKNTQNKEETGNGAFVGIVVIIIILSLGAIFLFQ
jgi:hypothetical protein